MIYNLWEISRRIHRTPLVMLRFVNILKIFIHFDVYIYFWSEIFLYYTAGNYNLNTAKIANFCGMNYRWTSFKAGLISNAKLMVISRCTSVLSCRFAIFHFTFCEVEIQEEWQPRHFHRYCVAVPFYSPTRSIWFLSIHARNFAVTPS